MKYSFLTKDLSNTTTFNVVIKLNLYQKITEIKSVEAQSFIYRYK